MGPRRQVRLPSQPAVDEKAVLVLSSASPTAWPFTVCGVLGCICQTAARPAPMIIDSGRMASPGPARTCDARIDRSGALMPTDRSTPNFGEQLVGHCPGAPSGGVADERSSASSLTETEGAARPVPHH